MMCYLLVLGIIIMNYFFYPFYNILAKFPTAIARPNYILREPVLFFCMWQARFPVYANSSFSIGTHQPPIIDLLAARIVQNYHRHRRRASLNFD